MTIHLPGQSGPSPHLPWPWAWLIALALVAQLALIWNHAPWADELQAVLLARDTNTLSAWYTNFRYEGHPPLWHLLLKLLLTVFDELTALRAATSIAALTTAWLIYCKSPFGKWAKLMIGLNYFILFEYSVIARGYCLGVVFIFAAIAWLAHPISWLLAALIPQAGAQMIFFPGVFAAIMLTEKRWSWAGATLCALGAALAAVWMIPAPEIQTLSMLTHSYFPLEARIVRTLVFAGDIVFPLNMDGGLGGWTGKQGAPILGPMLIGAAIPLLVFLTTRTQPLRATAAVLFVILTYAFSAFGHELSLRHYGFIPILVIACQWIDIEKGRPLNFLAFLWLSILAISGLIAAIGAVREPFSPSIMVADHLARTIEPDRLLIPVDTLLGSEITALTGRPTFNVTNQCLQTFLQWKGPIFRIRDSGAFLMDEQALVQKRKALNVLKAAAARAGGRALLILDTTTADSLHLIAEEPNIRFDRYFHVGGPGNSMDRYLYRLDVPPDPNPVPIPPCVP